MTRIGQIRNSGQKMKDSTKRRMLATHSAMPSQLILATPTYSHSEHSMCRLNTFSPLRFSLARVACPRIGDAPAYTPPTALPKSEKTST
jgi:hypothetical protein